MNNEELKKKIVEIIINAIWKDAEADYDSTDETEAGSIADALIEAGVVDKSDYASMKETAVKYKAEVSKAGARAKEAEHRAEVAERAVYNMAYGEWQREGARRAICEKYAPSTARDYLDRAEKELAEERKDD